eukprot:14593286-Alexandrium_andersonii.AAC.1
MQLASVARSGTTIGGAPCCVATTATWLRRAVITSRLAGGWYVRIESEEWSRQSHTVAGAHWLDVTDMTSAATA